MRRLTLALFAAFSLAFQPAPVSVGDCLLRLGDSHEVYDHPQFVELAGQPDPGWKEALRNGELVSNFAFETDTGERSGFFLVYQGDLWVFVYRNWDSTAQPPAREPMPDGGTAWHGSCMLRISP